MAKYIEHRDIVTYPDAAWSLSQHVWQDSAITQHQDILPDKHRSDQSIAAKLLTIKEHGHVQAKTSYSRIKTKLDAARSLSEAVDIVIDLVWGEYILVLDEFSSARRLFMADPLHSVRLYYRDYSNGDIRIDTRVTSLLDDAPMDWNLEYLIEFATTQFGTKGETPFSQIKVVPPGYALIVDIDGQYVTKRVWHPKPTCGRDAHFACAGAIGHVYSSIAARYSGICTAISGGVDSSASAIFLRRALGLDIPLKAIHLFSTSSPECNERSMAIQVADSIGAELICIDVDRCLPFSDLFAADPPSCLNQDMLFLHIDKTILEAIGSSSVVLEGQGGDLLFNAVPDAQAVLDAWRHRGWSFALHTAEKLAMLHNESIPRILLMAVKIAARQRLFRKASSPRHQTMARLLHPLHRNAGARQSQDRYAYEPSGSHISLRELDQFVSVMTPVTDLSLTRRINPFLAQPIVEASMNIRSYDSFDYRNDRIVLRRIAREITRVNALQRRTKGTFDVGFIKGIQSSGNAFHDLVRNGVLMAAGRIDERQLQQAFKEVHVGQGAAAISLALLGCVEIFCASWQKFQSDRKRASAS